MNILEEVQRFKEKDIYIKTYQGGNCSEKDIVCGISVLTLNAFLFLHWLVCDTHI